VSLHENETMSAVIHAAAEAGPGDAERIIGAFLAALGELGYERPSNSYRAIITRAGLKVEVYDDGKPAVKTYGTPAPVEEIAEFIGDAPQAETLFDEPATFEVGDKVRITGNGPGGDPEVIQHFLPVGAVGVVVSVVVAELARVALVRVGEKENYVSLRHLEHA
jgi:hypothetical protein